MPYERSDTIVTLGCGGVNESQQINIESRQRVEAAVRLFNDGIAQVITMSGKGPFTQARRDFGLPEADSMKQEAIAMHVPESSLLAESESLDTIGNAYFVKKHILEPRQWKAITLVTSESHVKRAQSIFRHVLGDSYLVTGVSSGIAERKNQQVYEHVGLALERQVLHGTKVGGDEEIFARLQHLIPGYSDIGVAKILGNHIKRFGRPSTLLR